MIEGSVTSMPTGSLSFTEVPCASGVRETSPHVMRLFSLILTRCQEDTEDIFRYYRYSLTYFHIGYVFNFSIRFSSITNGSGLILIPNICHQNCVTITFIK